MSRFKEYVTNVAFNLTLTRNMCAELNNIKQGWKASKVGSHFIPTVHCLIRRGLVTHHDTAPYYKLTKEGELVAQLVEMAEIEAREKEAA